MSKLVKGVIREYILITLSHIEKRDLTAELVAKRLRSEFECCSIVIAKEMHNEDGGFHFHVALKNKNASKNNATKLIRKLFEEFEGSQCNVKFHRGWGIMVGYVTKEDKKPYVWGQYSLKEILEMGEAARKRKKGAKDTKSIVDHIVGCSQWFDMYKSEAVTERLIYGSYSNIRSVYEDLAVIKHTKMTPIQRIQEYLQQREEEKAPIEEYDPEDIHEKYVLLDWLACNLMFRRPIKTKQLHIYGQPSTQKTFMFEALKKVLRIYFASSRMNDFAGADDFYDLWVYDEFHLLDSSQLDGPSAQAAQAYRNVLLRVLDGQECRLDAKYSRIFTKRKNIPIIVISNTVTPMAREYGPFQERFMRLKFTTNIESLNEDRIIATLLGCMKRRAEQIGQDGIEGDAELFYNGERVLYMNEKLADKLGERYPDGEFRVAYAKTAAIELIRMVFHSDKIVDSSNRVLEKYKYATIEVGPDCFTSKKRITALRFATIPLRKRKTTGKPEYTNMHVFNCKRIGANFEIIRNNQKDDHPDYMIWPMKLFFRNAKKVWSAQMTMYNKPLWNTERAWGENEPEADYVHSLGVRPLNDQLQLGVGTLGKNCNSSNPQWDEDKWHTDD